MTAVLRLSPLEWISSKTRHIFVSAVFTLLPAAAGAGPEASATPTDETTPVQLASLTSSPVIGSFYQDNGNQALWTTDSGLSADGRTLAITLLESAKEGLEPEDYLGRQVLDRCLDSTMDDPGWCEIQLTDAYLRYAEDIAYGRYHHAILDPEWYIENGAFDAATTLLRARSATDMAGFLASLPPVHPQYTKLRRVLASYRAEALDGEWPVLPDGPMLEPGAIHPQVALLRQRLAAEGYTTGRMLSDTVYDDALLEAVKRFQSDHGLKVDGKVGPRTRGAMGVSLSDRIALIRLNMERWRWLPRNMGRRYLLINIPAFQLDMVKDEQVIHRMRTITGRPDRTSPSFDSYLTQIVLNPTWTVPKRLAVEDILPRQQQDPEYLQHKQIAVLQKLDGRYVEIDPAEVDWQQYNESNFPFLLRQAPGPKNSLGRIKFIMPNPFAIFLHDTPAKALFNKSVRTLSSGCIRLQEPLELANWLLQDEQPQVVGTLQQEIDSGELLTLPLDDRIPVYLVYLTAWVDEAGNLQIRDDIYGRNQTLLSLFLP